MATKTITSDKSETKVGTSGTKLYTATRITYNLDNNGKIDPKTVKREVLYYDAPLSPGIVAATSTGTLNDWTFSNKPLSNNPYFGVDAQKSLREGALKNTTNTQIKTSSQKEGLTPEQTKAISSPSNTALSAPSSTTTITEDQFKEFNKELGGYLGRRAYPANSDGYLKYPLNLKLEAQDCIKFTIQEYKPSGLTLNRVDRSANRKSLVSIFLPIPGGISDQNSVNWQSDSLSPLAKAAGDIASSIIYDGAKGGINAAQNVGKIISSNKEQVEAIVGIKMAQEAVSALTGGSVDLISREFGAIVNPNVELLFNSPQLRNFSFTFRMSPRNYNEAISIRTIIRYFKQSMSAKRTTSNLLLKAPHTFKIEYLSALSKDKEHPYLNKFKECALTNCTVNYTPDGTYMSFNGQEPSMTSYELTLEFQELEPIFDDDYDITENKDKFPQNIGY